MPRRTKRLRHIYHLKKLYASWRLRLLKHEHTGKSVHYQHTSFALLALLLFATAAVLTRSTLTTYALDDGSTKTISAVVSGPPPVQKATITSPSEGATFTDAPIVVAGTCETGTYQQLFRNAYPSGTAQCDMNGEYSIQTDLFTGTNDLVVRSYNLGGNTGPDSDTVHVTYTPPAAPAAPPVQGSTSNATASNASPTEPLTLRNDYVIRGYAVGQEASWQVSLNGGVAPYAVSVHWGDGTVAQYVSKTSDLLTLTHTYTRPAPDGGGYSIIVDIVDAAGSKTTLQILALITDTVNAAKTATAGVSHTLFPTFGDSDAEVWHVIGALWTAVGAAGMVLLAFWLGEIRELRIIKGKFKPAHK